MIMVAKFQTVGNIKFEMAANMAENVHKLRYLNITVALKHNWSYLTLSDKLCNRINIYKFLNKNKVPAISTIKF